MTKTITLDETQMKLLKEYADADKAFDIAREELQATPGCDSGSPSVLRYEKAFDDRLNAAAVFASSVAAVL